MDSRLAGLVGVPALVVMQNSFGWGASAIWSGVFIWVTGIPATMLLRTRPEPYGLLPDGAVAGVTAAGACQQDTPSTAWNMTSASREALHTRAFWMLAIGWAIGNLGMGAGQTHLYLHLERGDAALTHTVAGYVWATASLANIPSRLIGGFLGDRLPKNAHAGRGDAHDGHIHLCPGDR